MNHKKGLSGKDVITIGIFSAIYFVINFACMLLSALHPLIWILLPGTTALLTGIPFLLMCAKVQKPGAPLIMGLITGLIYFVTGQFTVYILGTFTIGCGLSELVRKLTGYNSFTGNAAAFVCFSLGMTGSPLPIWLMRDAFLTQISSQGMSESYITTLEAVTSPSMIIVLFAAPIICGVFGALIARGMFKKHFVKAGIV